MTLTLELTPELETTLRAIAAREGLPPERYVLHAIEERLARDQAGPSPLPRTEAELLKKINEGLTVATWQRYHDLKGKRDAETLTSEEHAELIALSDAVEAWNVRRLEFVAESARLRAVGFRRLVKQLGISPPPDA